MPDGAACAAAIARKWNQIALGTPGVVTSTAEGGGALSLAARHVPGSTCQRQPFCPAPAVEVTQSGAIEGDFDAVATFEGFSGGQDGMVSAMRMNLLPDGALVETTIRESGGPALGVAVNGSPVMSVPVDGRGGSFRIWRRAANVGVTVSAGSKSIEQSVVVASGPIDALLALGIYNWSDTAIEAETSIRFTDFTITGTHEIESDTFDCL